MGAAQRRMAFKSTRTADAPSMVDDVDDGEHQQRQQQQNNRHSTVQIDSDSSDDETDTGTLDSTGEGNTYCTFLV